MKKTLLSVAFVFATLVGVNAQQTISFEASEGYTLGVISGQNDWSDAYTDSDTSTIVISDIQSTDGTQSLRFNSDNAQWDYYDGIIGAVNNEWIGIFDLTFDIYLDSNTDSDYNFYTLQEGLNGEGQQTYFYVSRLQFNWQSAIRAVSGTTWTNIGTYAEGEWYSVKSSYDFNTKNVSFYLGENLLATIPIPSGVDGISHLFISYDNYGSGMAIDNIKFTTPSASIDNNLINSFSIYPNPATNVINIANSADVIENVKITDMNGRVVKNVTLGVNEGQINISDLSQGVYILNATSNGKSFTEKVVKK